MKIIAKYNLLSLILLLGMINTAKSQILIPEELPVTGEIVFMKSKLNKLWVIQTLPVVGKVHAFNVSVKSGNRWDRMASIYLNVQNNSKGIRFTDIDFFGNRIFLSGDFALNGKTKNCLAYTETGGKEWFADYEFSSFNSPPVVQTIGVLGTKMYLGGNFSKINNVECLNIASIDKTYNPLNLRFYGANGANGPVNAIEPDSTQTSLYIGGLFKSLFGKPTGGFTQFKPVDSLVKIFNQDKMLVHGMGIEGARLLLHAQLDSTKPRNIFIINKSNFKEASGLDSLFEVSNLFFFKGKMLFSGSARLSNSNRETGIFVLSETVKTLRLYPKFNKIWTAEGYGDNIYVVGTLVNLLSANAETYGFARIDDNFKRFYGRVFHDFNGNGTFNTGVDTRISGRSVRISPYGLLITSDRNGNFSFILPQGKSILVNASIEKTSELASGFSYKFNADTFTERLVDFPIKFTKNNYSNLNIRVSAAAGWKVRKDTSELYVVKVSNNGLTAITPDVQLNFNGKIVLIKPFPSPDIIDPGKLTWSKQTLQPGDEKSYYVKLTTPAGDFADNQQIQFNAVASGAPDDFPSDNSDTLKQTVSSGVSPNAKYQYPEPVAGDTVAFLNSNAGKIDYIIRFTNLTADTLSTLVVKDTISTPDYVTYIQETGSSHPFSRYVYTTPALPDKVIVAYTFNNINLPPNPTGNTELVNSSGYVGFRLGLSNTISSGTALRNRAAIYMDNYGSILTNTVVAKVLTSGTHPLRKGNTVDLYPNPVSNQIFFTEDLTGGVLSLYNTAGSLVCQTTIDGKMVNLSDEHIQAGSYLWTVLTEGGAISKGILIKN